MIKTHPIAFAKYGALRSFSRTRALFEAGRQRGISLIEGILYLVLAISVVVGGIVVFQNAQLSNRVTEAARGLVTISSETRALHQNARDFGIPPVDLTPALVNAGAVPSNFLNGADPINHPWGGAVTVTGDDQRFTILLEGVPSEACVRLTSVDERGQGVAGIGIAEVSFDGGAAVLPAITPIVAGASCGNGAAVDIEIAYDR